MKKIIKLTESDLTNIVKRVIKENSTKDYLIDIIREDGWQTASELVGGIENLKKLTGIETPMEFLNLFNDLDVVQSEEDHRLTLFQYEKGDNVMIYNRKNEGVYVSYDDIWSFLEEGFGPNYKEIQKVIKDWLDEVYNLRGVTPTNRTWEISQGLDEVYNLR
jgi:hypothetical protein